MLQHGYNGSEVAPYQYEVAIHSLTIALKSARADPILLTMAVTDLALHEIHTPHGGNGHKSIWRVQIGEQGLGPTCGCEIDSSESDQASVVLRKIS